MSDSALAGQTIVAAFESDDAGPALRLIQELHLGGVIVLSGNASDDGAASVQLVGAINSGARAIFAEQGRTWPPMIAVDQEGGSVARIREPLTVFPAAMAFGAAGDPAKAREVGRASGTELRAAGFTMVLAPDADVTRGVQDVTIGNRSPSSDPDEVTRIAGALVEGYSEAGIVSVLKHFPGHGSLETDSHATMPTLRGDLAGLRTTDLLPFAQLVARGAPGVMVGHIAMESVDATTPASLSRAITDGLLRKELGFGGLVVTDSLRMGAVTRQYGPGDAAVAALNAGVDVLLMPKDPAAAVDGIVAAMHDGRLSRSRVEEAAARSVATMRHTLGDRPDAAAIGSHRALADEVARSSIVQLGGTCGRRMVGDSITLLGGTPEGRDYVTQAARTAGLSVVPSGGTTVALVGGPKYWAGLKLADEVRGTTADVVVSTDNPAYLALADAETAKLAVFGRGPSTYDSIVAALTGSLTPPGKLPVAIEGTPKGTGC